MAWQPSCQISQLKARAELYAQIRAFFMARDVLEVETPLLSRSTASDPQLASIPAIVRQHLPEPGQQYFLHTSPEFPMKRLLAAGSGAIFQICKTFRDGETGSRHNPEFSMLEWYQPDYSLEDLMNEVGELIAQVLGTTSVTRISYLDAFQKYLNIDPFQASETELANLAKSRCHFEEKADRDDYLNLLLAMHIEPHLGSNEPVFLYHYPASQASLAQTQEHDGYLVAERFELYIDGLEIANGYHELTDAIEQRQRFEHDNELRQRLALEQIPIDQNLLAAMESGLPACSGVALGLDRLLMAQQKTQKIDDILAFPIDRA